MQSYLNLTRIDSSFNKSLAKISSGLALPKPMYGPGQFAMANDMEAIYREYLQGAANVQDAQGLLEVAQTTMMEVNDLLLQMNDLAIRAANDTTNTDQRQQLNVEFVRLKTDIANVLADVRYNEVSVFVADSSLQLSVIFGENRQFIISTYSLGSASLGYSALSLASQAVAGAAVTGMQTVINNMSQNLARIGAQIQEVEAKTSILNEQAVQEKAMESRINELDFAKEMKNFTSLQVVLQASNAMVAQSNMKAQMVLQLFGG
jgi:flagellin